jgi:hypothetical protein
MVRRRVLVVTTVLAAMCISACSTNTDQPIVMKSDPILLVLPPILLEPCDPPFDAPPLTHSEQESAIRDLTWKNSFEQCALKPDRIREWYLKKRANLQ